jgi:hypothetical protein
MHVMEMPGEEEKQYLKQAIMPENCPKFTVRYQTTDPGSSERIK